ncbi:MAG: hypothetical protein ABR498_02875 [Candidatus Dormibacteria bacterium]
MVVLIVLASVLAVMLIAFLWFYYYSRTPAWGESETRHAMLRMLVVIGPIFGMHYRKPKPEIPTTSTPKREEDPVVPGVELPPESPS